LPEASIAPASVREAVLRGTATLAEAGCETPRLDCELLLSSVLGIDRARLAISAEADLNDGAAADFADLIERRRQREPVAYILGAKGFRRISLIVNRKVLIPRPETELLVEVALTLPRGARVVDVGCGSGAVALALKDERPDLDVSGTDISHAAVEVARENATRLGLDVQFACADLTGGREYDAVLANLPYVAEGALLQPEIAWHEPPGALYAGSDGLDLIRGLVSQVAAIPAVALEVGFDQAGEVAELLMRAGFGTVERLRDLAGHERVVAGRR
jgi:release factor glutamine methyltransferase